MPPLPPMFETFGLPQAAQFRLGIVEGATHDRFWFLSPTKAELIQFQQDRLLHNWRKVGDQSNEYPRFERMIQKFENELAALERYFASLEPQTLKINQCEVSYINQIPWERGQRVEEWLNFGRLLGPDDFAIMFRRAVMDAEGKPHGRLICEAGTGVGKERSSRIIQLSLTARGAPLGTDIAAGLEFLRKGREMLVLLFAEITSDSAHRVWERVQ